MEEKIEKNLWEELKLLQSIVNKFDEYTFRIKNWFFTIFAAVTGYAVVKEVPSLALLSLGIIAMFYFYEAAYRASHADFLKRLREVQDAIRDDIEPEPNNMPPNLDKYVLEEAPEEQLGFIYRLQLRFDVPESRAKRNIREWHRMFLETPRVFFQFRVTLPYIVAVCVSIFAFILSM